MSLKISHMTLCVFVFVAFLFACTENIPLNVPISEVKRPMTDQKNFKKLDRGDLKLKLTPLQYQCTQEEGTERPFQNAYWDNKEHGIYVDVVSGEPLFLSLDKYDSESGWPSFTKPAPGVELHVKKDLKMGVPRTEVRSTEADSHLGHVFDDGPKDRGGKRFCINSASLKFVGLKDLKQNGYGAYLFEFAKNPIISAENHWELATLAGGCFWGMEALIQKLPGVIETQVGYSDRAESIQVLFDTKKTSYEKILHAYFRIHDPTTENRQGNDVGVQYRSVIFPQNENQNKTALAVIQQVNASGLWKKPVVTQIKPLTEFSRAEAHHQKYLDENPGGYTCHFDRGFSF